MRTLLAFLRPTAATAGVGETGSLTHIRDATRPGRWTGVRAAARQVAPIAFWAVLPVLLTVNLIAAALHAGIFAYDFHYSTRDAGLALLHGVTPYIDPHALGVTSAPGANTGQIPTWFVYPAPAAFLFVPFAVLPAAVGEALFTAWCIGAVALTLRLLEVRDWRLYGVALLWPPVIYGWQTANVSLLLMLGIALAWRNRDRPFVTGALVGLLVSVKLFVWPLGLWLLATRRHVGLAWAVASGLAVSLAAWAVVGFDQIPRYEQLLRSLTRAMHGQTSSWSDIAYQAGLGAGAARNLAMAIAAVACLACMWLGRRGRDEQALLLCIVATLAATPILWAHYYALLLVPVALLRPRLSPVWAAPIVVLIVVGTVTHQQYRLPTRVSHTAAPAASVGHLHQDEKLRIPAHM